MNEWNLSPRQFAVLCAVADTGCVKSAARNLGLEIGTVKKHIDRARVRMGAQTTWQAVIQCDRMRRPD